MDPNMFSWIIHGGWVLLVLYLTVAGFKAKRTPSRTWVRALA